MTFQKHEWSKSSAWKLKPSSMHLCFSQIKLEKRCGLHDSCSVGTAFSPSITVSVYISQLHSSVFPVCSQRTEPTHSKGSRCGTGLVAHLHHAPTSGHPTSPPGRALCSRAAGSEAAFGGRWTALSCRPLRGVVPRFGSSDSYTAVWGLL